MEAYHVATDRPMFVGQEIIFDETHFSGVHERVSQKADIIKEIYADPSAYAGRELEHHTAVALRELALEEVRRTEFPQYPSRLACLYVSATLEEAEKWGEFFAQIGRPTYHIVRLHIEGRCFAGDAAKCFPGQPNKQENLRLANAYWEYREPSDPGAIRELLVDGKITVLEIVKEIQANLPQPVSECHTPDA